MSNPPKQDEASSVRYRRLEKRGEGTYGIVFKAEDQITSKIVALKIMKLEQEEDGIPPTTLREMSILRSVSHPNLVKLEDVIINSTSLTLVFEYLEYDLRFFLRHTKNRIQMKLLRSYAFQMLAGINCLHTHRILHRDIKPDNILLNKEGYLKICDFGLARHFDIPMRQYSANVVSQWYRAPELLLGAPIYGLPIDVWSAGCIIAEMCKGTPLFEGDSDVDQLHKIFKILGTPIQGQCQQLMRNAIYEMDEETNKPKDVSFTMNVVSIVHNDKTDSNLYKVISNDVSFPIYPKKDLREELQTDDLELIDLIEKMLIFEPDKRITIQEAMKHPFFDSLSPPIRKMCSA
ncbi:hypothetical protein M9Y10_014120 [Tritrichomonas musculus]|uniref:cyclin-dependent kinase n=1 Tax=Tritrichomonas musculus TaxID=1915356 RepID=A0ABR2L1V7_9EUKA